jgi:hypothetical protein
MSNIQPPKPIKIFYSYSHKDKDYLERLQDHLSTLKNNGVITNWHDRRITVGQDWKLKIDEHLNTADVILLLVSPDFIGSAYCYGIEMERAMQRHEDREALVIPIIIRDVNWQGAPFGKLNVAPHDGRAVNTWQNEDTAFKQVAKDIQEAIESRGWSYGIEYVDAWGAKFEDIIRSRLKVEGSHLEQMVQSQRHLLPACMVSNLLHFCRVQKHVIDEPLWLASEPEFDEMCKNIESDLLRLAEWLEVGQSAKRPLLFGDVVKLCHVNTHRRLHSRDTRYLHGGSSGQQQVTAYKWADAYDYWLVKGPHGEDASYKQGEPVLRGDIIRLEHICTQRNLHSHNIPAPLSPRQNEVTCFGNWGNGDSGDNWCVETRDDAARWTWDRDVKLIHVDTGRALHSHEHSRAHEYLRENVYWEEHGEVTCYAERDENDWWVLTR